MTDKKTRYIRKIIKIRAADSPNVALALQEKALGLKPSGRQILPGVLSWEEYQKRRATWHPMRQCVGLDAEFWEGKENLLYPPDWLNRAEERARALRNGVVLSKRDTGVALGIDTAEGGDNTALCVIDRLGVLELRSEKTADTSVIPGIVKALGRKWRIPPENWVFDTGGGGSVHANLLRSEGYPVRTVAFGTPLHKRRDRLKSRLEAIGVHLPGAERDKEDKYVFLNKRAEMYFKLRLLLDPTENPECFGIPPEYHQLRFQMTPIPLLYDGEGRIFLPPKHRRGKSGGDGENTGKSSYGKPLVELIGHSPDELDALVIAVDALDNGPLSTNSSRPVVGPAW